MSYININNMKYPSMTTLKLAAWMLAFLPVCTFADGKTNPLYKENANKGENPLYTEQSAANPGGSGASGANSADVRQNLAGQAASPKANHNTTRSNRIQPKQADGKEGDASGNPSRGSSRAQDYNSSRSNTTAAVEKLDEDGTGGDSEPRKNVKAEKNQQRQEFGQVRQTKGRD